MSLSSPRSISSIFDSDLVHLQILPFCDSRSLLGLQAADREDRGVVQRYRASLAYGVRMARSAHAFLAHRIISLHCDCRTRVPGGSEVLGNVTIVSPPSHVTWAPGKLTELASAHADVFTCLLSEGKMSLAISPQQLRGAVSVLGNRLAIEPLGDGLATWPWKAVIRFVFSVAASYGDLWPESSFALEACARAIKNSDLLALFASDPCTTLEKLATSRGDHVGRSLAAILGAIMRTVSLASASFITPTAEALAEKAINRVKTRQDFSFALACTALLDRMKSSMSKTPSIPSPGSLFSSISLRKMGGSKCEDIDLFARLLGVSLEARLRPRFESTFVCEHHIRPRQTVASVLLNPHAIPSRMMADDLMRRLGLVPAHLETRPAHPNEPADQRRWTRPPGPEEEPQHAEAANPDDDDVEIEDGASVLLNPGAMSSRMAAADLMRRLGLVPIDRPHPEMLNTVGPGRRDTSQRSDPRDRVLGPSEPQHDIEIEDGDEITELTPAMLTSMVNQIAQDMDLNPVALSRQFLEQDATAIGHDEIDTSAAPDVLDDVPSLDFDEHRENYGVSPPTDHREFDAFIDAVARPANQRPWTPSVDGID